MVQVFVLSEGGVECLEPIPLSPLRGRASFTSRPFGHQSGLKMQADLEPIGKWERLLQPVRNKFTLHAELGLSTQFDPDSSRAIADVLQKMARYIDLMEAYETATRQLFKMLGVTVLLIGLGVLVIAYA